MEQESLVLRQVLLVAHYLQESVVVIHYKAELITI